MRKTFIYNSLISILIYIFSSIISIVYSIFLGRSIGSDGLGQINLIALSLSSCNMILNLGIGQSIVFFYSRKTDVVPRSLIITLLISLISVIVFLTFDNLVFNYFPSVPQRWIYLLILITPFVHLKNLAEYYYAAVNNFMLNSGLNLIDVILKLILSYFFIFFFPPLDSFFYALVVVSILIGLIPWIKIINDIKSSFYSIKYDFKGFLSIISYGIPSYFSVLVAFLSLRIDQFLISTFLNTYDLGIYVVAVIFSELPFKVSNAITKVLFANISSKNNYSSELSAQTLRIILICSLILILIIFLLGDSLIRILYGESFKNVYKILLLLLPGSFFFNITQILNSDLAGRGYPAYGMKSGLLVLIFSIMINIIVIPRFGLPGVAVVSSFTYAFGAFLILFFFLRITRMPFKELFQLKKSDFYFRQNINER